MLSTGRHPTAGFVVISERRRRWEHGQDYSTPAEYFVLIDSDCNGVFDVVDVVLNNELHLAFPPGWIREYTD